MVLLLFRELNFHSRFINRAAGNVLAVYVLDGTVQTFLLNGSILNRMPDRGF